MTKKAEKTKQEILASIEYVFLLQFFKNDASTPNRRLINQTMCFHPDDALKVIYQGMSTDEKGLLNTAGVRPSILQRLDNIPLNNHEHPVKLFGLEIYRVSVSHI